MALRNVECLNEEETGAVLSRLNVLGRWVQAQQAKVLSRMQNIYESESMFVSGRPDSEMAFSLAAEEAATILGVPTGTGTALMSRAGDLCTANTATLGSLEAGEISYGHAETVLEQCVGIAPADVPVFEAKLLGLAAGQTKAQFRVKARRLRESQYPQTIVERQRTAFDRRSVWVRHEPDGMSWFSAMLPAETAQGIYHRLSVAARGEQAAGDTRSVDQLRADIVADLLGGHEHECTSGGCDSSKGTGAGKGAGEGGGGYGARKGSGSGTGTGEKDGAGSGSCRIGHGSRARTEILVVITAETLLGADDQPAELVGYGPISPERARRMAREAAKWTPAERDPETEEILRVGKRRKVPDGLKQLLRVRDGTCRFPGCRTNAVISEIDHTKPFAQGGPTDHDNLEHLCRRHHMFKTKGFWKACQPSPGIIEWTSPGGRKYRTSPDLTLPRGGADPQGERGVPGVKDPAVLAGAEPSVVDSSGAVNEDDYGSDPPPF
ncbi:HNH endonuclease signature motif containing protein [Arthrobacter sp. G119Y2]|uniref:HNH endonuclease signature motif containing protein n=1 Tax=Arthrobacter sp. G119Y2 TaxID=3134965 RepID=UPI00311A90E4